jgi:hypothetical protein
MANVNDNNKPPNRAQTAFAASEVRDKMIRQQIAKERAATDAKTLKLRALRLAKEEEERAAKAAAPPPVKSKRSKS